ncbi:formate dehydrogenase subunit gamma [Filomicrobium sp.]|uniref:formate dehydrogenase subunit gamma n=1 Tax=Filomicrobium sp. TaxID=2024831 RepID=UPI0025846BF5|nr:formate dehydrogenase subunit gamma [Filomicrobium sp.]
MAELKNNGERGAERWALWNALIALLALFIVAAQPAFAQSSSGNPNVRPPAGAVNGGATAPMVVPEKGGSYDIELWTKLRQGVQGQVSIMDKKAGVLVDSSGETWRAVRNGPLPTYGAYAMAGILGLLALFFLIRGRIRIEHGKSGATIERFNYLERTGHWLLATSFVILALTGLNVLYGRYVLIPVMGKEAFASMSIVAKWLHNYVAFAFMAGLLITFVLWLRHNFPSKEDFIWLAKGGGMFSRGVHPPARKFNAGQKILFWLIMLSGISITLSGLSLMFPFDMPMFSKTFAALNMIGFDLPTQLTANEEQQLASLWHAIMALFLICVIFAHIYIGTLGMEGAFDAMGTGQVDTNWAKEHHSVWAEEELAAGKAHRPSGQPVPAE